MTLNSLTRVCLLTGLSLAAGVATALAAEPDGLHRAQLMEAYGRMPLRFEANQGQTDRSIEFLSRGSGYALYLNSTQASFALLHRESGQEVDIVSMSLEGANKRPLIGEDRLPGTANYLLGNDPSRWHTGIPAYARVRGNGVYPGIDLIYYGNQQQLEYDFIVAPHADPGAIRFRFAGASNIQLDADGNLVVATHGGAIRFHHAVIYQLAGSGEREPVAGAFALRPDRSVAFAISTYDHARPLIIDPTLSYSTYLGGSDSDVINAIAVDSSGAAYLTGSTASTDYPITPGVFRATFSAAFITKLNASGTALVYSSFLGGSGSSSGGDSGESIAVDASGNAYVAGITYSTNFPVTSGAYQSTNGAAANHGATGFVAKVNSTGTALVYATYLGGTTSDAATSIAVDSSGDAYLAGYTFSSNFPTTAGVYQTTNNSAADFGWNQFVTKLNPAGAALLYSTYLGGSDDYSSPGNIHVAIDSSGDAYVAGIALSTDFPTTKGAYQTVTNAKAGHYNITLAKFNPTATALIYSTYFGGSGNSYGDDQPNGLAVDGSGNAYFCGATWESNFPVTSGAYQKTSTAVTGDLPSGFVTKMNASGSALVYSTYLGGSGADRAGALAIDGSGDVYVTGSAHSSDFPVTSNAYQSTNAAAFNSGAVVFLTEFNPAGAALLYSTYFGGANSFGDTGEGIVVTSGGVYLAGITSASNFPITSGAYKTNFTSSNLTTGFVAEFSLGSAPAGIATGTLLTPSANPTPVGSNVTFTAAVTPSKGTGIVSGNVVFSIDEATVATVALNSKGYASYTTVTPLALGKHAVLSTYAGNSTYAGSGGNITETVVPLTPTIAPAGGVYPAAQMITLSSPTAGAALYYTTDGSTPSASSTKYSAPFEISASTPVRVIAIASASSSQIAFAAYSIVTAPTALAVPASSIGTPNATLNALVQTYGMSGSYYFVYGVSSTSLTSSTPRAALPVSALGSRIGVAPIPVSAVLSGLASKTVYYFKVAVITPAGASFGSVLSFTTN